MNIQRFALLIVPLAAFVLVASAFAADGPPDAATSLPFTASVYYETSTTVVTLDATRAPLTTETADFIIRLTGEARILDSIAGCSSEIALNPTRVVPFTRRAYLYEQLNHLQAAIDDYTRALALLPDKVGLLVNRGILYARTNRRNLAIKDFDRALVVQPGYSPALCNRAIAQFERGYRQLAREDLDEAVRTAPEDSGIRAMRGVVHYRLGNFDDALDDLDEALRRDPADTASLSLRGTIRIGLDRPGEAAEDFRRIVERDPNDLVNRNHLAHALFDAGRFEDVFRENEVLSKLEPGNVRPLLNIGIALWRLGRNEEAIAAYDRAAAVDPNNALIPYDRGFACLDAGRNERALDDLTTALKSSPDDATLLVARGITRLRLKRAADAKSDFSAALDDRKLAIPARVGLVAATTMADGAIAGAEPLADLLHRIDADGTLAVDIGFQFARLGLYDTALTVFDRQIAADTFAVALTTAVEVRRARAQVLMQINRTAEAETTLVEALRLSAGTADLHADLALLREKCERFEEALASASTAVGLAPRSDRARAIRGTLRMIVNDVAGAHDDFAAAVEIAPSVASHHVYLAAACQDLNRMDEALAEYARAGTLEPDLVLIPLYRCRTYLYMGRGADCATDARTVIRKMGPENDDARYRAIIGSLGLFSISDEAGARTLLESVLGHGDKEAWPYDILVFLHGDLPYDTLIERSDTNDKLTETRGYGGLFFYFRGRKEDAQREFDWVIEHGNRKFIEYDIAKVYRKRLDAAK